MAAMMLASCSSDKLDVGQTPAQPTVQGQDLAVGFDAYANRSTTRAGVTDVTDISAIQKPWDQTTDPSNPTYGGFGVFGYYTDNNEYDQLATPNFMYNQRVEWDNTNNYWKYDPVKYWPNEYGTNAISDDADKVSFFAYAPYVEVSPASGKLTANNAGGADATYGITGMSRNTASGDPIIKYIGSFDNAKSVDLCWGVCNTTTWPRVNGNPDQELKSGLPWLNVERPQEAKLNNTSTQNVKFQFMHALAKMKFTVNAFVDGTDKTNSLDSQTKIWIRSIRFTGFAMKGALNLNNETPNTPYWTNYNGIGDLETDGEVIVYDGRKDGKEAVKGSVASNEKSTGLNPQLVETDESFATGVWATTGNHYYGVTKDEQNLFDGTTGIFFAIPTDDKLEIEIVYDVETIDNNLGTKLADNSTPGSSIENRITKSISFGDPTNNKIEAGKGYVINLHLGMNDVNFDAAVAAWEDVTPTDVDLPANVPFFTASATGTGVATIPYNATSLAFGINGLNGGEAITATVGANKNNDATNSAAETASTPLSNWAATNVNANASGYCVQTLTTDENPSTSNRTQKWTWTGSQSGYKVDMTFTQLAHPIELAAPATTSANTSYTLQGGFTNTYGFFCKGLADDCATLDEATNGDPEAANPTNGIVVYRNGTKLRLVDTTPSDGEYTFTDNGVIAFGATTVAGDIIKVVLKTGDAAAETISWKVE